MIYQPTIFIMGYQDARVSSSVILVYVVTIKMITFHAYAVNLYQATRSIIGVAWERGYNISSTLYY